MTSLANQNGHIAPHFDLDAARAARQAATTDDQIWTFSFNGRTWSFCPPRDMPANAKAMLADGDVDTLIGEILVEDPAEFWASRPRPTVGDIEDLTNAWSQWQGVGDLPNSAGSPPPPSLLT